MGGIVVSRCWEQDEVRFIESPLRRFHIKRKAGEPLHPERESKATLLEIRATIGEYNFASQYQQTPVPLGGAIVKAEWLKRYDKLPWRLSCIVQSWDTANKSGELNDFSVCTTWGIYDARYYLMDVFRKRLNYPELKRAVIDQASKYDATNILIEDKASGTQLIQDLGRECLYGVTPYEPVPGADKVVRLYSQTAEFENGRVLLPTSAPWLDEYVRELITFPGSKFDDQVDSTAQALDHLKKNATLDVWMRL